MDFIEEVKKLNLNVTNEMVEKFNKYYRILIEVNQTMNLTAITEENEVFCKHFLDSLEISRVIPLEDSFTLCDVGSGAGFPSIPLAIISDKVNVTIVDALNKRIKFLQDLVRELDVVNVEAIHARAEDYAKEKRAFFDVVTARAVARLNVLLELCMPLVKRGGVFIAMKGSTGDEELEEAKNAIGILGGVVEQNVHIELPEGAGKRQILVIRKTKETPIQYPRIYAKIKERPL